MQKCDLNRAEDFLNSDHYRLEDEDLVAHLDHCETCRRYLESKAGDRSLWSSAADMLRPDEFDQAGADAFSIATVIGTNGRHPVAIQDVLDSLGPTDDPHKLGRLGHYEITGVVGIGGMGVVLKAVDPSLERVVAVKVMSPSLANNEKARRRFSREAKAAAAVLHPNVVPIHGVSSDGKMPFLVMPYIRGGSLQSRLEQQGPLQTEEVLRIGSQVAAGLAAAHEKGLVHRDIKPENILLEEGVERVTITDFGLARAVDDNTVTQKGAIAGTPMYMSPEQAQGDTIDQKSDLFSLGSVLYALCTGRPPFTSDTTFGVLRQIIDDEPPRLKDVNPNIPDWLSTIVERLMEKKSGNRFDTAAEVQAVFDACLSHIQQPEAIALPPLLMELPTQKRRFYVQGPPNTGIWIMSIMLLAVTAVLALQQFTGPDSDENLSAKPSSGATSESQQTPAERLQAIIDQWKRSPNETRDLEIQLRDLQEDLATGAPENTEASHKAAVEFTGLLWPHLMQPMPESLAEVMVDLTEPSSSVRISDAMAKSGQPTEPRGWDTQSAHAMALAWSGQFSKAFDENRVLNQKVEINVKKGRLTNPELSFLGRMRSQQSVWKQIQLQRAFLYAVAGDLKAAADSSRAAGEISDQAATKADVEEIKQMLGALGRVMESSAGKPNTDRQAIIGTWKVTYSEDSGRVAPQKSLKDVHMVFTEDQLVTEIAGNRNEAEYSLNPTASEIDFVTDGRKQLGIYDLQGDTLRLCFAEGTGERPTAFDSQPNSPNDVVLILKRVKSPEPSPNASVSHEGPLSPALAKTLLPVAASMSVADFRTLSRNPQPNAISDQTLTFILMTYDVRALNPGEKDDLIFAFSSVPKPSELVDAVFISGSKGYASFIQEEYITDCQCQPTPNESDRAIGTVSFKCDVYKGTVSYQAEKRNSKWIITEFHLPQRGITTRLTKDGTWKLTSPKK